MRYPAGASARRLETVYQYSVKKEVLRQAQRSRGESLGFFVIYFLVARAVIAAGAVTVALFPVLEAVRVWGFRDYAAA